MHSLYICVKCEISEEDKNIVDTTWYTVSYKIDLNSLQPNTIKFLGKSIKTTFVNYSCYLCADCGNFIKGKGVNISYGYNL